MTPGRKPGKLGPKRLSTPTPPPMASRAVAHFYDHAQAEKVLDAYIGGKSLMKIGQTSDFPTYPTLLRWLHDCAPFREKYRAAAEVRGIHAFEEAMAAVEGDLDKNDVPAASLKHQALRWAAEVNDPAHYGKQTKVTGDANAPLRIIVETGLAPNDVDTVVLDERGFVVSGIAV